MPYSPTVRRLLSLASPSLFLALLVAAPLFVYGQGNEFFSCTDSTGRTIITNRHYDPAAYRCVAFASLNKEFREAEARGKKEAPRERVTPPSEREMLTTAQSAQLSAESARVAMEAARTAAAAAEITAQAVRTALEPDIIIISPQSSASFFDRRFVFPNRPGY